MKILPSFENRAPGLVDFYDIGSGNGTSLFLQLRSPARRTRVVTSRPSMSQLVGRLESAMRSTDWTSCSRLGRCAVIATGHVKQMRLIALDDTLLSLGCWMLVIKNFTTGSERQTDRPTDKQHRKH